MITFDFPDEQAECVRTVSASEAKELPSDTPTKEARKPQARSRISNGSATVAADGRTIWVRRLRDLIEAHEADLGGTDSLSQAQRSLVRRAATLSVELERMEATFATAGKISADDLDSYQRASNTLRRHLEVLGLRTPSSARVPERASGIVANGRVIQDVRDDLDLNGVCVGRKQAKYDAARRIAYAVAQAKESGERLHPSLADLAVQLRLADYADGEGAPDTENDTVDAETVAREGWASPVSKDDGPESDTDAQPPAYEHIHVKAGGLL